MANRLKLILNLLLLFCLVACSRNTNISPLLKEAEGYMNERPDSALLLLDSITHREDMSKEQNALWCLLYTQAQDKNRIEHTSDSLIQIAVKYYEKTNLKNRKMQAYYYCGRVFQDLDDVLQTQAYYLKAYEVGKDLKEYSLLGRLCANLGTLYTFQELYRPALDFQKEAVNYFMQDKDTVGLSITLRNIARIHVCENQLDSAVCHYLKALAYTSRSHKLYIFNELADTYGKKGDYQKGLFYAQEAYTQVNTIDDSCLVSLTLGDLYLKNGQLDSSYIYLLNSQKSKNSHTLAGSFYFLHQLEKLRGNLKSSLSFLEKYEILRDSIDKETYTEMLYRLQSIYDYQMVENEKESYKQIAYEKTIMIYLISLIGITLLGFIIIIFVVKNNKKRKKEEALNQSLRFQKQKYMDSLQFLWDKENSINRLKQEIESEQQKVVEIERLLNNQLELERQIKSANEEKINKQLEVEQQKRLSLENQLKRIMSMIDESRSRQQALSNVDMALEETLFRESDTYRGLTSAWNKMDEEQWKILIDRIDHLLYIDFTGRLRFLYPGISDIELRICCLTKLNIPVKRIASLFCITSQAVSASRRRLYTKLTGRKGTPKDFDSYILDF